MKKLYALIFILGIFTYGSAQNWKPIGTIRKYNYALKNNYYTVWADSVKEVNGDSVFFMNRVIKPVKPAPHSQLYYYSRLYKENQSQFFLSKISYALSGDITMYENDSIRYVIKPYLNLNDSWLFDSLHNNTAKIAGQTTETIFGMQDSIKLILLKSKDTIILSKNHGIIKFPIGDSLHSHVNLAGIEGQNAGLQLPKFKDFFDYSPGDVFYYVARHEYYVNIELWLKKITIKKREDLADEIRYTIDYSDKETHISKSLHDTTIKYKFTPDVSLNYKDSSTSFLNKYGSQRMDIEDDMNKYKPVLVGSGTHFNVLFKSYPGPRYLKDHDTICEWRFVPLFDSATYGKGIGCIEKEYVQPADGGGRLGYFKEILIGYKKNGNIYGDTIPDSMFVSVPVYNNASGYKIYPNPAKDQLTIESLANKGKVAIAVFNINGAVVMEEQMNTTKIQVDLGQLPSGMYFVKLISDETVEVVKVIKE